jgi:hypothetical protein
MKNALSIYRVYKQKIRRISKFSFLLHKFIKIPLQIIAEILSYKEILSVNFTLFNKICIKRFIYTLY